MKKVSLLIVSLLFIIPLSVKADEFKVESLEASVTGTTIKYNGTMEDGATAVKCWLYEGTTELDYFSSAVDTHKFDGTFTVLKSGDYKVKCANYEGGDVKTVDVTVTEDATTTPTTTETTGTKEETKTEEKSTPKNPKTGDNILIFVTIMFVSLVGIIFVAFKLKKSVK